MARYVAGTIPVNANVNKVRALDITAAQEGYGVVPTAVNGYIAATEYGDAAFHQTVLTLTALPQTVVNGTEYQGTKIYDFPAGRIYVLGCTASLQQTTTSDPTTTINASITGAVSVGTVTASNVSLTSTMVNLLPSTAFTASATQNVGGTAVGATLAAAAFFDGTSTAIDAYLNSAFATTADVDANGTMTWTGNVTLTWINLGDY